MPGVMMVEVMMVEVMMVEVLEAMLMAAMVMGAMAAMVMAAMLMVPQMAVMAAMALPLLQAAMVLPMPVQAALFLQVGWLPGLALHRRGEAAVTRLARAEAKPNGREKETRRARARAKASPTEAIVVGEAATKGRRAMATLGARSAGMSTRTSPVRLQRVIWHSSLVGLNLYNS